MPSTEETRDALLDAALPHVAFDGWTDVTWRAALAETGINRDVAESVCPRRATDLALAYHARGDAEMVSRLSAMDLSEMRFRDRITLAVRLRLEAVTDKEAVRRGSTLFALPQNAGLGARVVWETADTIWSALGDTSRDINWYTKRTTLAGVYGATVLFWLGDDSPEHRDTWAFLDRRIGDVMQIETLKAKVRDTAVLKPLLAVPEWIGARIKAPAAPRTDMPGAAPKQTPPAAG